MSTSVFLAEQAPERKEILSVIHEIILAEDTKVKAAVGNMMGKEMILYTVSGAFKYGLSSVKTHMSLHLMPIYCEPNLHTRYETLLNKAKFQKGCINFKSAEEMPINVVKQLIKDCSKVDLNEIMERFKKKSTLK